MLVRVSSILTMLALSSRREKFIRRRYGVPGGIRTPSRLIRSQKLYPVELQAQARGNGALPYWNFDGAESSAPLKHSSAPSLQQKVGGQRDSNPQQPEPQSGALPLSYDHQLTQILGLRFAIAKAKGRICETGLTGGTEPGLGAY